MALLPPIAVTAASDVATNGTLTFGYPARTGPTTGTTTQGDFKGSFGHTAYSEGLQAFLLQGVGFSISFGNSSITWTYLGTSTIKAGTVVKLQLNTLSGAESALQNPYLPAHAGLAGDAAAGPSGSVGPVPLLGVSSRAVDAGIRHVNYGTPTTASATAIVNAVARVGAALLTTYGSVFTCDVPRTLQYVSSNAGDTTQTVKVTGTDEYGVVMTEQVSLNGTTIINGKKAFKTVVSDLVSATLAGNLSIGTDVKLGLPFFLAEAGHVVKDILNAATATAGTYVAGDLTAPTSTTGDVRGTYSPNSAPSTNTNTYESIYIAPVVSLGLTQA